MIYPAAALPAFNQRGQSSQRTSGVFYNTNADFPQIAALPLVLVAGTTTTTDPIQVLGYNTFMAFILTTANTVSFRVTHVHPITLAELTTRTIATSVVGTLTVLNWGWGSALAQGGSDCFNTIVFKFVATAGANSNLTQFPGIWGAVR